MVLVRNYSKFSHETYIICVITAIIDWIKSFLFNNYSTRETWNSS